MGEKSYRIGNKLIRFSECDDRFGCLCTFPHNHNEQLDLGTIQSLALFGAAVKLVSMGYYQDWASEYVHIPNDLPDWIIQGILSIGE